MNMGLKSHARPPGKVAKATGDVIKYIDHRVRRLDGSEKAQRSTKWSLREKHRATIETIRRRRINPAEAG